MLASDQRGFTIVELLVASLLGLVIVGASVTFMIGALHSQPRANSRAAAVQHARVAMESITRELRQASSVTTATASQLSVVTFVNQAACGGAPASTSRLCQVTYTCSGGICSRAVANPGASGGTARQLVSGLSSNNVFRYPSDPSNCDSSAAASPAYVCVELALPAFGGGNAITLDDAVAPRNLPSS